MICTKSDDEEFIEERATSKTTARIEILEGAGNGRRSLEHWKILTAVLGEMRRRRIIIITMMT